MILFLHESLDSNGEPVRGYIQANDSQDAVDKLKAKELFPLQVTSGKTFKDLDNQGNITIMDEKVTAFVTESGKIYDSKTLKRLDNEDSKRHRMS